MLRERISDPVILRLVDKWLRAGVLREGLFAKTEEGVPQGGPVSPILANIYLHYVLDLWFEKVFKHHCDGQSYLVRYADDFVVCFQKQEDARAFMVAVKERLGKFHLEIAEEKSRRIVFGRFAAERMAEKRTKPEEFNFLGFRHICGRDRAGKFALIRLPVQKSISRFLECAKQCGVELCSGEANGGTPTGATLPPRAGLRFLRRFPCIAMFDALPNQRYRRAHCGKSARWVPWGRWDREIPSLPDKDYSD
jgi:hypothetical protein